MGGQIRATSSKSFDADVLKSPLPVFVDFYADWCGPCRVVEPIIESLAAEYDGKVKFVRVDVDENPELASRFDVMSIPTLMIFKGGRPAERIIGAGPKDYYERHIKQVLA